MNNNKLFYVCEASLMIMDLTFHISYFREREREIDRKTDGKNQKERSKIIREGKRENTQKGTLRPSYRHEE